MAMPTEISSQFIEREQNDVFINKNILYPDT